MDKENLYRQIILDHYNNPQNRVDKAPDGYITQKGINPSCGDQLEIYIKEEDGVLKDIKFSGDGCSICCSSASILTNELKDNTSQKAQEKITNFDHLIKGENFDEDLFEDAIAFGGLAKFPARYKCAFLGYQSIKDFLNEGE